MAANRENWWVWMLIGVAGSGKTRIGREVATRRGWPFLDADRLHPAASIERMAQGVALDDTARWPWLDEIGNWIDHRAVARESAVVACSALKRSYRDELRGGRPRLRMILLEVGQTELVRRLEARRKHFMGPAMLNSQLAAFEPPSDESIQIVDANGSIDQVVAAVLQAIADAD